MSHPIAEPVAVMLSPPETGDRCANCGTAEDIHPARFYYADGSTQRLCRPCMRDACQTSEFPTQ